MKISLLRLFLVPLCFAIGLLLPFLRPENPDSDGKHERESAGEALKSFEWWYAQRALPGETIPAKAYDRAFRSLQTLRKTSGVRGTAGVTVPPWHSIGPANIGGRTLALAVDPIHPGTVWAGSASGGLWKTTTGGLGSDAWNYVNTGYNTIAVSAIAIDHVNPSNILIGTGEISLYHRPLIGTPGARASYGMGVLRSTNGGTSWEQTGLTFTFPQITAVQRIAINPLNTQTVFAATSEGVYRSTNGGIDWSASDTVLMAMDVAINPADTTVILAVHGNLNSTSNPGMYRSSDGGKTWQQITSGLPPVNFGRGAIAVSTSNPSIAYAGIADAVTDKAAGLFRSTDYGLTWNQVATDYISSQGWYNNVVAVSPSNSDTLFCGGLSVYRSINGGSVINTIPTSIVHVDQHALAFDPSHPRTLYIGCDGGIYRTTDGGDSFQNLNNNYCTTQFYPGFANAATDPAVALGGLQDNGTLLYSGSPYWQQVNMNDGGWCAINPLNADIQYSEYQYLVIQKTSNRWSSSTGAVSGLPPTGPGSGESSYNFIAPFVLAPSSPTILYAGAKTVYRSTNSALSWYAPAGSSALNGTKIACIGVSKRNSDTLMAATGSGALSDPTPKFEIFTSTNGGQNWSNVTGSLPNRYPTHIEFDPASGTTAYLTYSGYGTPHIFRTTNLGLTWDSISTGLPDIPHQSIAADPEAAENLYAATDLGVFHSSDSGQTWEEFTDGMPPAMVLDVTISPANASLRASTFGNGVWERRLLRQPVLSLTGPVGGEVLVAGMSARISWKSKFVDSVTIRFSPDDGATWSVAAAGLPASDGSTEWTVPGDSTSRGRILVADAASGMPLDSSRSPFSILVNPDILAGWDLVSLSRAVADPRVGSVYPGTTSRAFTFTSRYVATDSMEAGTGYWVKFPTARFFTVVGDSIRSDTISLHAGWNIIGPASAALPVGSIQTFPDSLIVSRYFGYRSSYTATDTLMPGHGYWIKTRTAGLLVAWAPPAGRASREISLPAAAARLVVREPFGGSQTLLLTGHGQRYPAGYSELPPLPPAGLFDARFSGGGLTAELPAIGNGGSIEGVDVVSTSPVVSVDWEPVTEGRHFVLVDRNGKRWDLMNRERITVPAGHLELIASDRGSVSIPSGTALAQNYPNPFNPTTTITYTLSRPGRARVTIYSTTGQLVDVLSDSYQPSGRYSIEWSANNLASGIYFCRLDFGNYHPVIKLLLVR